MPINADRRHVKRLGDETMKRNTLRLWFAALLVASNLGLSSGCATLAHRSSVSGERVRSSSHCAGAGDTCPWLLGDALLLIPGIVPGVIAFAVDFGTGAWRHDAYSDYPETASRPDNDVILANDPS